MKDFVQSAIAALGGHAWETENGGLLVDVRDSALQIPGESQMADLVFAAGNETDGCTLVTPGCVFLDEVKSALAGTCSARHGLVAGTAKVSRRALDDHLSLFIGEKVRLQTRRHWLTRLRCWFRLTLVQQEISEEIIIVELLPGLPPVLLERADKPTGSVQWVDRPPLPKREFNARIEEARTFSDKVAAVRAGEGQKTSLEHLCKTLRRVKRYYLDLRNEAADTQAEMAATHGYENRKADEVYRARVNVKLDLFALETISRPARRLTWFIERDGVTRRIEAIYDELDEKMVQPVCCEVCNNETDRAGLTREGLVVCPECYANCARCGDEIVAQGAADTNVCHICEQPFCQDHAYQCTTCKQTVCNEHGMTCRQGCRVCRDCALICVDCGPGVVLCPDHAVRNRFGQAVCREHVLHCAGCQEPFAQSRTDACVVCGQTVCRDCRQVCEQCQAVFCLNHFDEERCPSCQEQTENRNGFAQTRLF